MTVQVRHLLAQGGVVRTARRVVRREVLSRLVEVLVVPSKGCLALAVVVSIGERDAENIKCVTNPGDP